MGLFSKRPSEELPRDHHPVRDGALAGAVAHHEATNHPGRDALLAGGAVGEVQHHRNKHNHAVNSSATQFSDNHLTNGLGDGHNPSAAAPIAAATATAGPAPLAGVHANQSLTSGSPAARAGSGQSSTVPTVRQAASLERKAKTEGFFGDILCSKSMKAKAHTHAARAGHLRMQASELAEAERLEAEAGMRRQRAVGLGADTVHASGTTGYAPATAA